MIISEYNYILESLDILDHMDNVSFSMNDAKYVPVQRNLDIDKDLIHIENLVTYAESADIDDAGIAIANVCHVNKLDLNDIGFIVNESTLLYDFDCLELVKVLKENAFPICVTKESTNSVYYKELEKALALDEGYDGFENSVNILAFCEEFPPLDYAKKAASTVGGHISTNVNNVKEFVSSSPKKLASKLSVLKNMIASKTEQLKSATGSIRATLSQQIDKLKSAYNSVKEKLSSLLGNKK